ncbi:MAG: hypothetical protein NVS2B12_18940 [Ktedonobacteraceae bacterium]
MQDVSANPPAKSKTREALSLVVEKWTVLVIHALRRGTRRLSELQREIDGVSQKMLIQTLRRLEQNGLVQRTVYPVVPPMVEYKLTPLGETLLAPLGALCCWAEEHMDEVYAARTHAASSGEE